MSVRTRHEAIDTAEKIALTESSECAEHIQAELNKALIANRTLCETIGSVKEQNSSNLDRSGVNTILKNTLQKFPDLKENLIAYNSKFSMLNSPMAKVVLPLATIKMMRPIKAARRPCTLPLKK